MEPGEHSRTFRRSQLHFVAGRTRQGVDHVDVGSQMVATRAGQRRPGQDGMHQVFFAARALHRVAAFVEQREFSPRLAVPYRQLLFERTVSRFETQFKPVLAAAFN